jgi:hypothetical protein
MLLFALEPVCVAQEKCIYRITASGCRHEPAERTQTGFIVSGTRGIYTALHGVIDATHIGAVNQASDKEFSALHISKADPALDVALLDSPELDGQDLPGLERIAFDENVDPGPIRVLGHPFGIDLLSTTLSLRNPSIVELQSLLTQDAIGSVVDRGSPVYNAKVLSIQGEIEPGHSGAPILDSKNRVLAIANGGLKGGTVGICWAIPLNQVHLGINPALLARLGALRPDAVFFFSAVGDVTSNPTAVATITPPVLTATPAPSSTGRPLSRTSDISYALTTGRDPVQPGKVAQFTITVTNLTDSKAFAEFAFHVPEFTTYRSYSEGTPSSVALGWVAPGASASANLDFKVLGGNQSPPDGSIVTLVLADLKRGASISHSVTISASPMATLDLSTQHGTVAPGEAFDYLLTYHNASGNPLVGPQLSIPMPVGASLVSTDGGGMLSSDQIVRWQLGALAAGATGQIHLNLIASTAKGDHPALLLQAELRDGGKHLLAQAGAFKSFYVAPTFSYALTTTKDRLQPGKVAQFTITVTNLTDSKAFAEFAFHVPEFTTYRGYSEGTPSSVALGWVAPGASASASLDFKVLGGNQSPPDGSIVTLVLTDLSRGASVSRSVMTNSSF